MSRKKIQPEAVKLAAQIDLIAREMWRGLPSLKGVEPVNEERIKRLFFEHASEESSAEILRLWPAIIEAVKLTQNEHADEWNVYESYLIRHAVHVQQWNVKGVIDTLAERFNLTPWRVRKTVKEVPLIVAQFVGKIAK